MSEQQQNSEYSQKYSSISLELKVSSNSWEIDGETVETVSDLIFLGSKITADGDCSHEIKRRLLLGRKVMTNLDSIFKTIALTRRTLVGKVMSLLLNILSRLVITFLPRSKRLLIS